ncbi:MAG: DUF4870 domain-containing protein [Patescibacteria group bacterium]
MDENTQNPSPVSGGQQAPQGQKKGQNTMMAIVAYILFFIPLLTDAKNDPFVKYHVKQGFVLFIAYIIVMVVSRMLYGFGFGFGFIGLSSLLNVALLVLLVMGIMHAINGEQKPLPLIGQFADKIKFL